MGWEQTRERGEDVITGAIGDPLSIHVTATLDGFNGRTWIAQIRLTAEDDLFAAFTLDADNSTSTEVDLLFTLADTTAFVHGVTYYLGVQAITGLYTPYTLIPALAVKPYEVVPRAES